MEPLPTPTLHILNYFAILDPSHRILAYVSKKLHSSAEMLKNTNKAIAIHAIESMGMSPVTRIAPLTLPMVYYRTRHQATAIATSTPSPPMTASPNAPSNEKPPAHTTDTTLTWILSLASPYRKAASMHEKQALVHESKDVPPAVLQALLRLAHTTFGLLHGPTVQLPAAQDDAERDVDLDPLVQAYASDFVERMECIADLDALALLFSGDPVLLPVCGTPLRQDTPSPAAAASAAPGARAKDTPWVEFRMHPAFAMARHSEHFWSPQDLLALAQWAYLHPGPVPATLYLPTAPHVPCHVRAQRAADQHVRLVLHPGQKGTAAAVTDVPPIPPLSPLPLPPPSPTAAAQRTFVRHRPTHARWPADTHAAAALLRVLEHADMYLAARAAGYTVSKQWIAVDRATGRGQVVAATDPSVSLASVMDALLQQDTE